jgi:hypothetical protein
MYITESTFQNEIYAKIEDSNCPTTARWRFVARELDPTFSCVVFCLLHVGKLFTTYRCLSPAHDIFFPSSTVYMPQWF